ncbi:MAG: RluA family pseudouridine synthase [Lachnospiraceae bacterium]|nr:RluA family pseudouridine synthase [Lachnospiraceae bacterium]
MRTKILYEDKHIIVVHKPAGIAVQSGRIGQADVESELKNYLAADSKGSQKGKQPYLGMIHRLDQPVEGVLVFAKTSQAAAALNRQLAGEDFCKDYYAVVCGKPEPAKQELVDYIKKEGGLAKICPPSADTEAKKAMLSYEVLFSKTVEQEDISMLAIRLKTGRFHQIRAQLSHAVYPLLGDAKYGSEKSRALSRSLQVRNVALCAVHLSFQHPVSGKKMEYSVSPKQPIFAFLYE